MGVRKGIKWFLYSGWPLFGVRQLRRRLAGAPTAVYFYPEDPRANLFGYAIKLFLHRGGVRYARRPAHGIWTMRWEDQTEGRWDERLQALSKECAIINARCLDISKNHVEEVFVRVFGYSSLVDPTSFVGDCVEKSDANGKADGRMITCPIEAPNEACVYQIRIDTTVDDELVDELRIPIFGQSIPFIMTKYKRIDAPFSYSVKGTLDEVADCLSEEEEALILRFCAEIGLDCGELDVLRDRPSGKLYIVDANNTPSIHFAGYSKAEEKEIISRMARAFDAAFGDWRLG